MQDLVVSKHSGLGWRVPEIHAVADVLEKAKLKLERWSNFDGQDDRGIRTAPGGAKVAWFRDSDQNLLSIRQF